jgi:Fe2+ or Zn2+ uptake regulation protein
MSYLCNHLTHFSWGQNIVEPIIRQIRDRGERLTIQRRLVIEILCETDEHLTIMDIQRRLQERMAGQALSETTIYRILEWLKSLEIVSQTDLGKAGIVYTLLGDTLHHHLVCLSCGAIINVDDDYFADLRGRLRDDFGFAARIDHMAIYGQCPVCASQAAGDTEGDA